MFCSENGSSTFASRDIRAARSFHCVCADQCEPRSFESVLCPGSGQSEPDFLLDWRNLSVEFSWFLGVRIFQGKDFDFLNE